MIRTAYGIDGDPVDDCVKSTFCPCCSVNQLLQTAAVHGPAGIPLAGKEHNTDNWIRSIGSCTFGSCCFALFCLPCAIGSAVEGSTGMPFWMGCCCVNFCSARNIIRYHYRIHGNDLLEECLIPCGIYAIGLVLSSVLPCLCFLLVPALVTATTQLVEEAKTREGNGAQRYLVGYVPHGDPRKPSDGDVYAPHALHNQPAEYESYSTDDPIARAEAERCKAAQLQDPQPPYEAYATAAAAAPAPAAVAAASASAVIVAQPAPPIETFAVTKEMESEPAVVTAELTPMKAISTIATDTDAADSVKEKKKEN